MNINALRFRRMLVYVLLPLDIYVEWDHSTSHSTFSLDVRRWLWPHRCKVVRWFGGKGSHAPLKHDGYDSQCHMNSIWHNICKTPALKHFAEQLRASRHRGFQLAVPMSANDSCVATKPSLSARGLRDAWHERVVLAATPREPSPIGASGAQRLSHECRRSHPWDNGKARCVTKLGKLFQLRCNFTHATQRMQACAAIDQTEQAIEVSKVSREW